MPSRFAACAAVTAALWVAAPAFAIDADKTIGEALAARGSGDYVRARSLLQTVLVEDTKNARALHELGVLHAIFGELDRAAAMFERALQADPTLTASRRNLAEILRAAGHHERALEHFKTLRNNAANGDATARNSNSRDIALRGIAICEEAMGRPEAAIAALDELSKHHKDDDMARWVLQQRALLVAARKDAGVSVGMAEKEADLHFRAKRYMHAAHWYDFACRRAQTADRCHRAGIAQLGAGDYLTAVGSLRRALILDPKHLPSLSAWPTAVRKLREVGSGALNVDLPVDAGSRPIQRAAKALLDGDLLLARRTAKTGQSGPMNGVVLRLIEAEALLRDGYRRPADEIYRAILRAAPGHHLAAAGRAEVLFLDRRYPTARSVARLAKPPSPPANATAEVTAAYGSPNRDLQAYVQWRRRTFDHHMRMLLDPGVKPPPPFSFSDAIDPESVRPHAAPAAATGAKAERRSSGKNSRDSRRKDRRGRRR